MEEAVLSVIAKAVWDPQPTTTDEQSLHLAEALGYPFGWRVVRKQEKCTKDNRKLFVDRIFSGDPSTPDCDCWMNHAGAMEAAASWGTATQPSQYMYRGGHMLPLQSSFRKGDKVQVLYEEQWWDAKILRVKEYPAEQTFKYQVYYFADSSKQSGVDKSFVRRPIFGEGASKPGKTSKQHTTSSTSGDPAETAAKAGFPEGWQAFVGGRNKWKLIAPDGTVYPSKKAALAALEQGTALDTSNLAPHDPPWRTTGGDPLLGCRVLQRTEHRVSARRTVTLEQEGVVMGYIDATDVDRAGQPGFVSTRTQLPASLYHVKFTADRHAAYAEYQVTEQDMDEDAIRAALLPDASVVDTRAATAPAKSRSSSKASKISAPAAPSKGTEAPPSTEKSSAGQPGDDTTPSTAAPSKEKPSIAPIVSENVPGDIKPQQDSAPNNDDDGSSKPKDAPSVDTEKPHAKPSHSQQIAPSEMKATVDEGAEIPEKPTPRTEAGGMSNSLLSEAAAAGDKRPFLPSSDDNDEHDDKRQRVDLK